jgi:hypothetical protein
MRMRRSLAVDVAIVLAWGALIYLLRDMSTRAELLAFIWGTFFVGVLSGRYRIAVAPLLPFIAIAFAAIADQNSCDPSASCSEDPIFLGIFYLAVLALLAAGVMAIGVFLRQRWQNLLRTRGPEQAPTPATKHS